MSNYSDLFDQKLIFWDVEASNQADLYQKIASNLRIQKVVKPSYFDALTKRESEFPTGLKTRYLPIALPHANPENVNKAFISVVQTKKEIDMKQMGTNEEMETKNFFFLGIVLEKQDLQVKLLQRFMQLMNNQSFVDEFKELSNPTDVYQFLIERF